MSLLASKWLHKQAASSLDSSEFRVLNFLCWRHTYWREVELTQRYFAEKCGMTRPTLKKALVGLHKKQFIGSARILGRRGATTYFILFDEETKKLVQAEEWKAGKDFGKGKR